LGIDVSSSVSLPMRPLSSPPEDELPPPEDGGDDDDHGVVGDRDTVLPSIDDREPPEFADDELPTDPTFDIDLPPDVDTGDTEAPIDLPLGPDIAPIEEEPAPTDDALGFVDARDREPKPTETDEHAGNETADGFDDARSPVDESEFPTLDADDGPELPDAHFGPGLESADEAALPMAERAWGVHFIAPDREHCAALGGGQGVVIAGSSDLFWLDAGRETVVRIGLDGTRISSVALVGEGQKTALCVTAFGRLLRRSRSGGEVERLVDWRRVAEAAGSSAEGLELRGLGPSHPNSVLGRLSSGRLVRSDDMGSTFGLLDASITALAFSSAGDPVVILSRDATRLGFSSDGGSSFAYMELVSPAREVASGEAPLVAAWGDVVVLGEAERGLVVSADHGQSFHRVAGASNVTALAAGAPADNPTAFAAVYREAEDRSLVLSIDARTGRATTGAVLSLPTPDDPDAAHELGRVERLLWDGETLWAVGGFGLARIRM
jgi:hypothetical protein